MGFLFRYVMICMDPFLHNWDEHFHALVAKNMIDQPLKPMLFTTPAVPYKISEWVQNHIWVHKQPLFLWQMALSIHLFGNTEIAVRIPGLIMTTLSIWLVYRVCFLLTNRHRTALFAALLMCFSNYQFQLISGRYSTEHNDAAFGFYILASIWCYLEHLKKFHWKWVLLIGLFAGCAILNKWLTGLLIYSAWGIHAVADLRKKDLKNTGTMIASLLVCMLVFLPWQIYIHTHFPAESKFESDFNNKHLWEVLEDNGGSVFFYLKRYDEYYGMLTAILTVYGLIIYRRVQTINKRVGDTLLILLGVILIFFSFVVQTKMTAFVYCILPVGLIFAAVGLDKIADYVKPGWLYAVVVLTVLVNTLQPYKIWKYNVRSVSRQVKIHNTKILKQADTLIPPNIQVVMNFGNYENIDVMFYSKRNFTAYPGVLSEAEFQLLAVNKTPVAVFPEHGTCTLPPYVKNYPYLYVVPALLKDPY